MKKIKTLIGFVAINLMLLGTNTSFEQGSSCDPCTDPWGQIESRVYPNETVQGLMPHCTFDIHVEIQTRNCNGMTQIRLVDMYLIINNPNDPACTPNCPQIYYFMRKITGNLLSEFGGQIVVHKESSCWTFIECEPTPQIKNCIGNEATPDFKLILAVPCGKSCCITEYHLNCNDVVTATSTADPCQGIPPNPLPSTMTVYCYVGGVRTPMVVPVIPPTNPLTCENVCDHPGDIFQKALAIDENKLDGGGTIFPNPAGSEINISDWENWNTVKVFDLFGKLIMEKAVKGESVDICTLKNGNYLLVLENDSNQSKSHALIKE